MRVLEAEFMKGFIRMADDGWKMGWHERNGGNLSYRIKKEEAAQVKSDFSPSGWKNIDASVPMLAGEFFLVTGSGKFLRNAVIAPEDSLCIIEINEDGEQFRIVWGLVNGEIGRASCRERV